MKENYVMKIKIKAHQWAKNGDHPDDDCFLVKPDTSSATQFEPHLTEGKVIKRYSFNDQSDKCCICGLSLFEHGALAGHYDVLTGREDKKVCPGDWIVEDAEGSLSVCDSRTFAKKYEKLED